MTQKWLVPIDGSDIALHSVAWIVRHVAEYREPPQIHVINVQAALPDDIGRFIDAETLREFHLEAGTKALAAARYQLAAADLTAEQHVLVGEAEAAITDFEFAAFYRSLQAYERALPAGTQMVIPPDGDFFRYMQSQTGRGR